MKKKTEANKNSKPIIIICENGDIEFKGKKESVIIKPANIMFVKGCGQYILFKLVNQAKKIAVKCCMKDIKPCLNRKKFISTHCSFIASIDFMLCYFAYNNGLLLSLVNDEIIPVSPSRKKAFKTRMKYFTRIINLKASNEQHLIIINKLINKWHIQNL